MRESMKSIGKLLAVFAFIATALAAGGSVIGSCTGRDFARCVQGCNAARKACVERCKDDCLPIYPSSKTLREACVTACKAVCIEESGTCKDECQAIKNPPTQECP